MIILGPPKCGKNLLAWCYADHLPIGETVLLDADDDDENPARVMLVVNVLPVRGLVGFIPMIQQLRADKFGIVMTKRISRRALEEVQSSGPLVAGSYELASMADEVVLIEQFEPNSLEPYWKCRQLLNRHGRLEVYGVTTCNGKCYRIYGHGNTPVFELVG